MNTSWTKIGLGVCALAALSGGATAQKASNAERGLIGVNLYDTGVKVVSLYGSPDEIQAVSLGGTDASGNGGSGFGPGGGAGPSMGGGAGGSGAGPRRGGGSGGPSTPTADWQAPFQFGNDVLRQQGTMPSGRPDAPSSQSGSGIPSSSGVPGGIPGAGGGGTPGAAVTPVAAQYTRWVYNRAGSKYGFIVDNQGRVVQIEAIGLQNNRVKTRRGLGFGATFAQLIKTYGNPDGYEVAGDTILVKYLVNKKVAFRLTRLGAKKPHVVTGVVVSAGKV